MNIMIRGNSIGNIALELLKDCDYNCSGCSVETEGVTPYTEDDLQALSKIVDEVRERDWEMSWMEIAPTDIMSAANRSEVLGHPTIRKMIAGGFESIVFNCSFLNPKPEAYIEFAEELEAFMPGLNAEFLVPVELKHHKNIGYLDKLRQRIQFLADNLKTVRIGTVTAIVNLTEDLIDKGLICEEVLHETRHIKLYKNSDTTTFVFHYGRRDLKVDADREEFLRTILKQNEAFANQVLKGYDFKIDDLGETVGTDYHLAYRDGELYIAPFINSPIASFDEEFRFEKPWTLDRIIESDQQTYFRSVEQALTTEACQGCRFVSKCATRGVQRIQRLLGTEQCLSILGQLGHKAMW